LGIFDWRFSIFTAKARLRIGLFKSKIANRKPKMD